MNIDLYPPRLFPFVIAAVCAALCGLGAINTRNGNLQFVLVVAGVAFTVYAAMIGLDWIAWKIGIRVKQFNEAKIVANPVIALARIIADLRPDQLALMQAAPGLTLIDLPGPRRVLELQAQGRLERIPTEFLEDFMAQIHGQDMPAVRLWSGVEREWASAIIETAVSLGLAQPAAGPKPARLIVPLAILAAKMGVE